MPASAIQRGFAIEPWQVFDGNGSAHFRAWLSARPETPDRRRRARHVLPPPHRGAARRIAGSRSSSSEGTARLLDRQPGGSPCAPGKPMLVHPRFSGGIERPARVPLSTRPDGFPPPLPPALPGVPVRRERRSVAQSGSQEGTLISGVAARYASALFDLAREAKASRRGRRRSRPLRPRSSRTAPTCSASSARRSSRPRAGEGGRRHPRQGRHRRPRRQLHPPRRRQAPPLRAAGHDPRLSRTRRRGEGHRARRR